MQMQEIKLEEIEPTIRKIFAAGGDFTFYPKGTSMHPFVEQGRDKITLAPIQDQVRKYDVILYQSRVHRPASGRETLRRTPDGRRRHAGDAKQADPYRQTDRDG